MMKRAHARPDRMDYSETEPEIRQDDEIPTFFGGEKEEEARKKERQKNKDQGKNTLQTRCIPVSLALSC
jgi:hypothetical protein